MDSDHAPPPRRRASLTPWTLLLLAGVGAVVLAQFVLDAWADGSDAAHWTQHALLFWGGVLAGAAALRLYQLGSRTG